MDPSRFYLAKNVFRKYHFLRRLVSLKDIASFAHDCSLRGQLDLLGSAGLLQRDEHEGRKRLIFYDY